ncbi:MAG: hypothetical protein M1837_001914 [Sclerophora amabilis]|nr:MAG: hypothetical protein M1837_001914 [Sclerophora amabilis]
MRGNPHEVLGAIDEFGRTHKFLMNVGAYKGKVITHLMSEIEPKVMVELGGYLGYSCILFGNHLRELGGKKFFSLEADPLFAAISNMLIQLAGLQDFAQVIVGPSHESLRRLHADGVVTHVDLLFIDHYKPAYVPDLKLCEELGIVKPGSVLAADNVIWPGNPLYLEYVRSTVKDKRAQAENPQEVDLSKYFWKEMVDQQAKQETPAVQVRGNPNLVYDTHIVMSFEPHGKEDGLEISRCIREEADGSKRDVETGAR